MEKTNVMRLLDQKKAAYKAHSYVSTGAISGVDVAAALGQDPARVFKTLVTVGKTGQHYVFVIPVAKELDLKNYLFNTDIYEIPPKTRLAIGDSLRREMIEIFSGQNVY